MVVFQSRADAQGVNIELLKGYLNAGLLLGGH
jgi:hypothetical protein